MIAEFCKPPYEIDCVQLWYSVTKSFTGMGVGIASEKNGVVHSVANWQEISRIIGKKGSVTEQFGILKS